MPQRTGRTVTVWGGPQGDDAFVIVKRMTVEEGSAFGKLFIAGEGDNADEKEIAARKSVAEKTLDWNWVSDDGSPLPKPLEDPSVIGDLLPNELEWLFKAIAGTTDGQKKDLKMPLKAS